MVTTLAWQRTIHLIVCVWYQLQCTAPLSPMGNIWVVWAEAISCTFPGVNYRIHSQKHSGLDTENKLIPDIFTYLLAKRTIWPTFCKYLESMLNFLYNWTTRQMTQNHSQQFIFWEETLVMPSFLTVKNLWAQLSDRHGVPRTWPFDLPPNRRQWTRWGHIVSLYIMFFV